MTQPAGWMNDPYGRYQMRYWNGTEWTEHVSTNGVAQVDPLGASTVVPIAIPPTAYETPVDPTMQGFVPAAAPATPSAGDRITTFLDSLGPDAKERPEPRLSTAVAGLGGAVLSAGVLALIAGDDASRGGLIAGSLVIIAIAYAIRLAVKTQVEARAAAVGAVVIGIPVFGVSATVSDGSTGFLSAIVVAALFLVAWAVKGFQGRTVLLGLGMIALVGAFATLGDGSSQSQCERYLDEGNFDAYYDNCEGGGGFLPGEINNNLGTQGTIYLLGAAALLGGAWWLDRRGYRGTGTGLVAAGLLSALVGTGFLADKFGDSGGPLFVTAVGVIVCLVGSHGGRRATTWWGAVLTTVGVVSFIVVQTTPDSASSVGTTLLLAGILLVGVPAIVRLVRANQQNEPEQAPPASSLPPPTA